MEAPFYLTIYRIEITDYYSNEILETYNSMSNIIYDTFKNNASYSKLFRISIVLETKSIENSHFIALSYFLD